MDEAQAGEDDFDGVLRYLRALAAPCEPPVGVGAFDILYASAEEVVVWYSPARQEHTPGEVTIPCVRIAAAWAALTAGDCLDEPALERLGAGPAGGRWLLAVLAQLPGVNLREEPLALVWAPVPSSVPSASALSAVPAEVRRIQRRGRRERKREDAEMGE